MFVSIFLSSDSQVVGWGETKEEALRNASSTHIHPNAVAAFRCTPELYQALCDGHDPLWIAQRSGLLGIAPRYGTQVWSDDIDGEGHHGYTIVCAECVTVAVASHPGAEMGHTVPVEYDRTCACCGDELPQRVVRPSIW